MIIVMWIVIVIALIWMENLKKLLNSKLNVKFVRCDIDRVDKNLDFYEKDSYLTKYLHSKRELIYFDVVNIPPKKDKEKGTAREVSYWVEVHDYDQERLKYKEYLRLRSVSRHRRSRRDFGARRKQSRSGPVERSAELPRDLSELQIRQPALGSPSVPRYHRGRVCSKACSRAYLRGGPVKRACPCPMFTHE